MMTMITRTTTTTILLLIYVKKVPF